MQLLNSGKYGSKSRAARLSNIEPLESRTLLSSVVVNTIADSTDPAGSKTVSLRDAVAIANASKTATTITFSPTVFATAKTITLGGTQLELSNTRASTTITGPTADLTISGHKLSRVIAVDQSVTATLSKLTIIDGVAYRGGGIINNGNLVITDTTISGNSTLGSDGTSNGGGISMDAGTLSMTNDVVSANSAPLRGSVGGIDAAGGTTTLMNVTVAGNSAGVSDGGIGVYIASLKLFNVTISRNSANSFGGIGYSAGVTSSVTIANSIIAGNSLVGRGGSVPDISVPVTSLGHNLIGISTNSTGWISTDLTGTIAKPLNAELGSLANNGGTTQTLLPLTGSPAIDQGSNALIPAGVTTDQRGLPRIVDGTVDIGAVEVQPSILITPSGKQAATLGKIASVSLGSFTDFGAVAPFKLNINWGDGSAVTVLNLSATGAIPAANHIFTKTGSLTVSETITDARGNKSNVATFIEAVTAPVGSISGTVFNDANGDGKIDNGEYGSGLWAVYLDLNKDGKLDAGDKSVTTDINGHWSFTNLAAGAYIVRVVPVAGTVATKPTGNMLTITLTAGQNSVGNLFGEKAIA